MVHSPCLNMKHWTYFYAYRENMRVRETEVRNWQDNELEETKLTGSNSRMCLEMYDDSFLKIREVEGGGSKKGEKGAAVIYL